jgi:outer membrane lipoprotein
MTGGLPMIRFSIFILTLAVLTACSYMSPKIQPPAEGDLSLKQVADNINLYQGKTVRWGGKIIAVENSEQQSEILVVQFPLNRVGRPDESSDSEGRFFIRSADFLDPEVYKPDSFITVLGQVVAQKNITVDQKQLTLPVIQQSKEQRWPANNPVSGLPYNPKHDWPFVGYGYYGTGSYSP